MKYGILHSPQAAEKEYLDLILVLYFKTVWDPIFIQEHNKEILVAGAGVDLEFLALKLWENLAEKYAEAQAHGPEERLLKCNVNVSIRYWLSLSLTIHQATLTTQMLIHNLTVWISNSYTANCSKLTN